MGWQFAALILIFDRVAPRYLPATENAVQWRLKRGKESLLFIVWIVHNVLSTTFLRSYARRKSGTRVPTLVPVAQEFHLHSYGMNRSVRDAGTGSHCIDGTPLHLWYPIASTGSHGSIVCAQQHHTVSIDFWLRGSTPNPQVSDASFVDSPPNRKKGTVVYGL